MGHFEDHRLNLASLRLLVHVVDKTALALDTTVCDLADFLGIERLPRLVIQILIKGHDIDRIDKVYEGIANVTAIVQVERQVKEVVFALVQPVDTFKQHILRILVGDVPYHDRGTRVLTAKDAVEINHELRIVVLATLLLCSTI